MFAVRNNSTVGEVARSIPASIQLFERYGIDYCCGGNKLLKDSCEEKGLSLDRLLGEMQSVRPPGEESQSKDWTRATLSELISHILARHHSYLRTELPRLSQMLTKVLEVHGQRHGDSLQPLFGLYAGLQRELEQHMWKEENVLFPLIQRLEQSQGAGVQYARGPSMINPIQVMEFEHESAGNALAKMRSVTNGYQAPPDGCNTYRGLMAGLTALEADLHQHIHLENNILFPRALELEARSAGA